MHFYFYQEYREGSFLIKSRYKIIYANTALNWFYYATECKCRDEHASEGEGEGEDDNKLRTVIRLVTVMAMRI